MRRYGLILLALPAFFLAACGEDDTAEKKSAAPAKLNAPALYASEARIGADCEASSEQLKKSEVKEALAACPEKLLVVAAGRERYYLLPARDKLNLAEAASLTNAVAGNERQLRVELTSAGADRLDQISGPYVIVFPRKGKLARAEVAGRGQKESSREMLLTFTDGDQAQRFFNY